MVGQSAPFTGLMASTVTGVLAGQQLAIDDVNRQGGIGGRPLRLIALDDAFDARRTLENARMMVEGDHVVALFGLDFAAVMGGGAILTESVFGLHGVGQYAADSIFRLDIPPLLVITMLAAFTVVLLSALMDVLYAFLDPRIRL